MSLHLDGGVTPVDAIDLNRACDAPHKSSPPAVRGLVVASIANALGAALTLTSGRGIGWVDLTVLAAMGGTAIVGANEARRIVASRETEVATKQDGCWMNVVIGPQGPSETAGVLARPKAPPRGDPERRSLVRRAKERRKAEPSRR
jgi:hypothetical protein